jgi:hypothetical protein
MFNALKIAVVLCICLFSVVQCKAQKFYFGDEPFQWESDTAVSVSAAGEKFLQADLLILNDYTRFYFYDKSNETLSKNIIVKINNSAGLAAIQTLKLPESFDVAHDAAYYKQGRRAKIKIPFLSEFKLVKLGARKFVRGKWTPVPLDYNYEQLRWVGSTGRFLDEDIPVFNFKNLQVGDILEIGYELQFNSDYGNNLFYFHSKYPKLNCQFDFNYKVNKYLSKFAYVLPINTSTNDIKHGFVPLNEDELLMTDKLKLSYLNAINYPANSFEGHRLPHVFVDFNFYRVVTGSYSTNDGRVYEFESTRSKNFEWVIFRDTTNNYTKVYDKQFSSIRKFVATLPTIGADSSHKEFFRALCDTLNSFKYYTLNQLFYDGSNLYNVSSGDHLLKRRLVGQSWKICRDILNDNNIFYFVANVQDRRYGDHNIHYRAHYGYESEMIALPSKGSYIYFIPRYHGLKYHLNELPFYYEGSLAALTPRNFQKETNNKYEQYFKFIKTHKGTYNENTRTENATVKINKTSATATITSKESLSGQFSTVLRPLYLNDLIDSTIAPFYFKLCTQKPNAREVKIKLSSFLSEFPFRYTFNCSEKLNLQSNQTIDLHDWFSFIISKQSLPETPTHDYYFDFDFSDSYNFMLEFDEPTEITNIDAFSNKIDNSFFELESRISKNSESTYLLQVKLVVKERKIPLDQMQRLNEIIETLDHLNNFSLSYAKP